jgi:hypothetical protein
MWESMNHLTSEQRDLLNRLFAEIQRGDPHRQSGLKDSPSFISGFGDDAWWLSDDGHYLLIQASYALVGPSVASSGLSPAAAQELVQRTCRTYLTGGADKAIQFLTLEMDKPLRKYLVARPHRMSFPGDEMRIGRCLLRRGLPVPTTPFIDQLLADDFPAFTISTEVLARDDRGARLIARTPIAEALAVMQLASSSEAGHVSRPVITFNSDEGFSSSPSSDVDLNITPICEGPGAFKRSALAFSQTVEKDRNLQTDWERRCIAGTRWLANAIGTPWASDRIIGSFVALEVLCIADRKTIRKGNAIAKSLASLLTVRDMTQSAFESWLVRMYDDRNSIAHEGQEFSRDADADRLAVVTLGTCRWAVGHLNPDHSPRGTACTTYQEAHSTH